MAFSLASNSIIPTAASYARPPGAIGSYDPFRVMDNIAARINALRAQGPNLKSLKPIDYEGLRQQASQMVESDFSPAINTIYGLQEENLRNKVADTDFAKAYGQAWQMIAQGGQTGAAGEQYALQNFGSRYLGAVAATIGDKLVRSIADDFIEKNNKLIEKLSEFWAAMPQEKAAVAEDLIKNEEARLQRGTDIRTGNFTDKLAALTFAYDHAKTKANARAGIIEANIKAAGDAEAARITAEAKRKAAALAAKNKLTVAQTSALSKVIVAAMRNGQDITKLTTFKGPNGARYSFNPETGETTPLTGGETKPVKRTYRTDALGRTVEILPDGTQKVLKGDNPARPTASSGNKTALFATIQKEARKAAGSLWRGDYVPGKGYAGGGKQGAISAVQAYQQLMADYGQALLDAGISRKRVDRMLKGLLAGRGWTVRGVYGLDLPGPPSPYRPVDVTKAAAGAFPSLGG